MERIHLISWHSWIWEEAEHTWFCLSFTFKIILCFLSVCHIPKWDKRCLFCFFPYLYHTGISEFYEAAKFQKFLSILSSNVWLAQFWLLIPSKILYVFEVLCSPTITETSFFLFSSLFSTLYNLDWAILKSLTILLFLISCWAHPVNFLFGVSYFSFLELLFGSFLYLLSLCWDFLFSHSTHFSFYPSA